MSRARLVSLAVVLTLAFASVRPAPCADAAPAAGSLVFNQKGHVDCGDAFAPAEGTIEFWFKPASNNNNEQLLSIVKDDSNQMVIGFGPAAFMFMIGTDKEWSYAYVNKEDFPINVWHHVACTFGEGKGVIYVDGIGISKYTGAKYTLAHLKGGTFQMGKGTPPGREYAKGALAELRLSDVVRYETDFTPPTAPFAPDAQTVALWHFAEAQGVVVQDASGRNHDGKIIGEVGRSKETPFQDAGKAAAQKTGPEPLPCARAKSAPAIDGKLDDPCWSATAAATGFLSLADLSGGTLAPRQSAVRFAWDDQALYMAADCSEPDMTKLIAEATARDGAVWSDDCLELFLSSKPGGAEYYHYIFNALGTYYDARINDAAWNSNITVAAQKLADRWTLEAAIPFKELGVKPPAEGELWSFNVGREHQTGGIVELSSWARLSEATFHRPQEFAPLQFAAEKLPSGPREFSNRKPAFENPFFLKIAPDGKPLNWVLGPGTTRRETTYLAGTFELTTSGDYLMARQELEWRQVAGQSYNLTIMALGDGKSTLGAAITYRTAAGKSETLTVFKDEPVAGVLTACSKKVTIPANAESVDSIELYRANRAGTLSIREVQFVEASLFSGVKEAKRQFPEYCWPMGEPFNSPAGPRWATPLPGGPLSVLFILPDRGARLSVEMGREFDMQADVVWLEGYSGDLFSWGDADRVNAKLSRSAKPYDVIVLTIPLKSQAFRNIIRENVNQGAGLFLIHDAADKASMSGLEAILPPARPPEQAEADLLRGTGWRLLPQTKAGQSAIASITAGAFGKGRVVALGYNTRVFGLMPYGYALNEPWSGLDAWWEQVYSMVARGLLDCANRPMTVKIESVAADPKEGNLRATVAAAQAFQGALALQWTDEYLAPSSVELKNDVKIAAGEKLVVTWPIPEALRLAGGVHAAHLFLRDDQGKAADWFTATFTVDSGIRIGAQYPFPRDWFRAGQKIEGTISVTNQTGAKLAGAVALELVDATGRCVWRETKAIAPAAGEKVEMVVAPQLDRVLTAYHRVRATVSDARGVLARREWELRLPDVWKYDPTEFRFGTETSFNIHLYTDKVFADYFRSVGSTFSTDGGVYDQMPRFQLPWNWTHMGGGELLYNHGNSPNREHCFNNPEVLKEIAESAANNYPSAVRSGMVFSTVADEMELVRDGRVEVCFCPFCAAGFRKWAQGAYGDLNRLNAEWGTACKSWDEVKPITAEEIRKRGNYAQWVDFRGFMDSTFTQVCPAVQERIKRDYPDALIGLTNPFAINPFSGHDLVKFAKVEQAMVLYMRQDLMKEVLSLNPKAPSYTYFGYGGRPDWCRWYPWWFAMSRAQFLVWYQPEGAHPVLQLVDYLGRPTQRSVAVLDSVRDLLTGLGKVFRSYPPARNPAAILHSQPSMLAAWAESGMQVGDTPWGTKGMYQWMEETPLHGFKLHHRSQENFKALIKETSLQPDFLPAGQLGARLKDYRILILPYSAALSEEELATIDDFVKAGGTVLADLRTASYSGHGKPLPGRASFEAIFGVKRKSPGFDPALTSITSSGVFGAAAGGKGFDQPAGHEALDVTTGKAMARHADGAPALIVNARGKGKAVYMNFVPGDGPASTAVMAGVLELAGVKRDVTVTVGDAPALGYECFLFERAPVRFLGVLRDMQPQPEGEPNPSWNGQQFRHAGPEKQTVTIHLPAESHVYDARAGKYLGRSAAFPVELGPTEAGVFALLPYKVAGVRIEGLKPQYRQGEKVQYAATLAADAGAPGDHALRVQIVSPDGKTSSIYTSNVLAAKGRYEGIIPLALNDAPGGWTLRITDVASGTSVSAKFNVAE